MARPPPLAAAAPPLLLLLALCPAAAAISGADLGAATRQRVSQVLDARRAGVINAALDNRTTPVQALAVNQLLGVCGIPGWPTGNGDMGAWRGACRLSRQREWVFPYDHGLHCNMVNEWFFFVGTFHVDETVLGVELMFSFEKLVPDPYPSCPCEYDANSTLRPRRGAPPRLQDPSGRLAEVQFAVIVAPKRLDGSAVSPKARHRQAAPVVEWWTGAESEGSPGEWGFRIGNYSITSPSPELREVHIRGADGPSGLAVDLRLRRALPLLMQGGGSGYVGDPANGNGEAYYSLTGMLPDGVVTAGGRSFKVRPEHGMGWLDHQFGSVGVATGDAIAALAYGRYAVANQNVNPVNL